VAEQERVPQSRALPDPTLSLSIQNDGFSSIQIGKMETSWISIMASQTFPWAGKRGLRSELAGLGTREAEADLRRVLLSVAADVERAYVDLLLVHDQLGLLTRLESLWKQSEALARIRYEAGEAAQSDLLRAQLQRNRLRQQRWALEARSTDESPCSIGYVGTADRADCDDAHPGRPARPGVARSRTGGDSDRGGEPGTEEGAAGRRAGRPARGAGKQRALAGRDGERRGDAPLGRFRNHVAGWVAFNLPIWGAQKQSRAVAENRARGEAARNGAEAIRQLLRQRIHERLAALGALVEANHLYRSGLLVQSDATVASTLAQYQVGRVTFASVLEALAGYLGDVNGFYDSVAAAQRIAIAEREISLDPPGGPQQAEWVALRYQVQVRLLFPHRRVDRRVRSKVQTAPAPRRQACRTGNPWTRTRPKVPRRLRIPNRTGRRDASSRWRSGRLRPGL